MADAGPSLTLRLKIILTLLIGTFVLFATFAVYKVIQYVSNTKKGQEQQKQEQQVTPSEQDDFFKQLDVAPQEQGAAGAGTEKPPETPTVSNQARADLTAIALPFAERFGSYSNQSSYANLEDLLPFMTEKMQAWAKQKIASAASIPTLYKGVTAKGLSLAVLSLNEEKGEASVKVSTQRKELIGTDTNFKVYNQDLILTFAKDDTAWLVDSAQWQ